MKNRATFDVTLLTIVALIIATGFIMVTSASIPIAAAKANLNPFRYSISQFIYIMMGTTILILTTFLPIRIYRRLGGILLLFSIFLLAFILIPGVSRPINGSIRWLLLGPITFQPSELAKISLILYLASYIVRQENKLKTTFLGFLIPLAIIGFTCFLLLLEPDFGTSIVITAVGLGMLFLGGVHLSRFLVLLPFIIGIVCLLSFSSPYRIERLFSFLNPWRDQFDTGYQLVQSLIAFGRGGILGNGLGASVQKLHYLPEAHNDFIFAIIAEEFGLVGVIFVLMLFAAFVLRTLHIGRTACLLGDAFGGSIAYGVALWIGIQAIINIGVNIGLLPTKGITLPLMSSGGSSIILTLIAVGFVLRIDFENRVKVSTARGER